MAFTERSGLSVNAEAGYSIIFEVFLLLDAQKERNVGGLFGGPACMYGHLKTFGSFRQRRSGLFYNHRGVPIGWMGMQGMSVVVAWQFLRRVVHKHYLGNKQINTVAYRPHKGTGRP